MEVGYLSLISFGITHLFIEHYRYYRTVDTLAYKKLPLRFPFHTSPLMASEFPAVSVEAEPLEITLY